jgi:cytidine deaminase
MPINQQQLQALLASLPPAAATKLGALMSSNSFNGVISAADAAYLAQQMGISVQQLSLQLVPFAQLYAVTPISNFMVGAVSMGLSGALYYGANLEVAGQALSFTVHAEQAATSNAWVNGEQGLASLAVSAAPCGYCRQFLYEIVTAANLMILLPNTTPALLTTFLPDAFGPHDLGVNGGLMQSQANGLTLSSTADPTGAAALAAANASYSPYTSTFAGVALSTNDGGIVAGRYAENAAYNPSMSPLEAALSLLVLNGRSYDQIVEAVLVEATGPANQADATIVLLSSVTSVPLTVLTATRA